MVERRKHPRIEVCHPAMYSALIYASPKVASTVDLSVGGTRIQTFYNLISGMRLDMSVAIPPKAIKCRGRVVHVQWYDGETLKAGVQFEGFSEEDRLYLQEYISHLREQHSRGEKDQLNR